MAGVAENSRYLRLVDSVRIKWRDGAREGNREGGAEHGMYESILS